MLYSKKRRAYKANLLINGKIYDRILIDPHYEEKHAETVNDEIILNLVRKLNGQLFEANEVKKANRQYFMVEPLYFNRKPYRLVWFTETDQSFIGVINCFRRPYGRRFSKP